MRTIPLLAFISVCALATQDIESIEGVWVSKDDNGIVVFLSNKSFGYQIPTKHLFYSTAELPPNQGRYRVIGSSKIEWVNPPNGKAPFHFEFVKNSGDLVLVCLDGTKPRRSLYKRQ